MWLLLSVFSNFFLSGLTLPDAIFRANLSSYEIQIKQQEIKIKEGQVWQASLFPNPALDISYDSFWGRGPYLGHQNAVASYELQTLLEVGGKRSSRSLLACMDKLLSEWNLEEAKVSLLTHLKIDFIDTFIAQEKLRIEKEYLEIARQAYAVACEKMRQGKEMKSTLSRTKLAYLQTGIEADRQERELSIKKNRLSAYWNQAYPDFEWLSFDVECIPPLSDLCAYELNLLSYPGLIKQKLLINRAEKEVEVQKAYAYPDLLLSLGVDHEVRRGNYGMKVELNFPLPLFNMNQGKIFSAKEQVIQADLEAKEYYLELLLKVRSIYRHLELAKEELNLYQEEILPALHETKACALQGYQEGHIELIHFLENEKFYLDTQNAFLDTLATFHKFYAELCQYIRSIP